MQNVHTGRIGQSGGVTGDQGDISAALGGHPGHRITLLAGAAIPDEPHRIQCLAGAAGGHQDLGAGQVIGQRIRTGQQQFDKGGDLLGFG